MEVDASQIPAGYPTHGTQGHSSLRSVIPTGLSPSMVCHSRQLRHPFLRLYGSPATPHLPYGIRFALFRVRSPLLTESLLVSFPAGTKMLQFPAFPILTDRPEGQEVPFGHPMFHGCMRLAWAYRSLPRPSSAFQAKPSPRWDNGYLGYLDITRHGGLCRPSSFISGFPFTTLSDCKWMALSTKMDPAGFEPTASALQGRRSPN